MTQHLTWEPIFKNDVEKTGGIIKVRFVMYSDSTKSQVDFIMEALIDFICLQRAVDKVTEIYGDYFSTMVDTGAITLAETVQCSVDGIKDSEEWKAHLEYLLNWRDNNEVA